MSSQRRGFGHRINRWLAEGPGEQFTANKWRFWFLPLCGFQLLNAALTAAVFSAGDQLQNAMGAVVLGVGALLAWLAVAFLHYSDSHDRQLARGVSLLDSVTLICVLSHFTFLLWTFGHLKTLQSAEADYERAALAYNEKAEKISEDAVKIAASAERIATETTKAERLRNDTMYQARKAAEAGARGIPRSASTSGPGAPTLTTAPIELEKPEKPKDSSAAFLARWDWWIRIANLAELLLAAATLIYIRNRSAKTNAPREAYEEEFPRDLDVAVEQRHPTRRGDLAKTTTHNDRIDDTRSDRKTTRGKNPPGLKELRECLKLIAFENPPGHFKADVRDDYVIIRAMASDRGDQHTVYSAKAALSILDDAMTMKPDAFRKRLEEFLKKKGFEI